MKAGKLQRGNSVVIFAWSHDLDRAHKKATSQDGGKRSEWIAKQVVRYKTAITVKEIRMCTILK